MPHSVITAALSYESLCRPDTLSRAWQVIREKGSAGGIDGESIELFQARESDKIEELARELSQGSYLPQPYQEIRIPKKNREFRTLSLPAVKDKIVQQALREQLEPLLEQHFLDVSYAYRKGRGPQQAISRVAHLIDNEKRDWVTICDIDRFFDNIPHRLLFAALANVIEDQRILGLIKIWITMGRVDRRLKWKDSGGKGIPQGSVLSPLLSNFYLVPFDQALVLNKYGLVRYADDFVVLSRSESEAYRALDYIKRTLDRSLGLQLNPGSSVVKVDQGFEFLGIRFIGHTRTVTAEKKEQLARKLLDALDLECDPGLEKLSETTEGIARYYGRILSEDILLELDLALFEKLRFSLPRAYDANIFPDRRSLLAALGRVAFLSREYGRERLKKLRGLASLCRRKKDAGKARKERRRPDPVRTRKREYEKLESEGLELLISTPGVYIGKSRAGVSVRGRNVKLLRRPLQNLRNILIISRGVSLSSDVIQFCAEKDIAIDFIDFRGRPIAKIIPPRTSPAALGLAQLAACDSDKGRKLARWIVWGKIRNQINLCKYFGKYRLKTDQTFAAAYRESIGQMETFARQARTAPEKDLELLRGQLFAFEGNAAGGYWNVIRGLLDSMVEFEGRERKGARDLVNSLLNYGYGILYSRIWQAVLGAGLNPCVSYLHKPQGNRPTLIFDLIEEFRAQAVDRPVFSLISKGGDLTVTDGLLSQETRKKVCEKVLERLNTLEKFRGGERRLSHTINSQARAFAAYLEGKSPAYRPYIGKW